MKKWIGLILCGFCLPFAGALDNKNLTKGTKVLETTTEKELQVSENSDQMYFAFSYLNLLELNTATSFYPFFNVLFGWQFAERHILEIGLNISGSFFIFTPIHAHFIAFYNFNFLTKGAWIPGVHIAHYIGQGFYFDEESDDDRTKTQFGFAVGAHLHTVLSKSLLGFLRVGLSHEPIYFDDPQKLSSLATQLYIDIGLRWNF